MASNLSEIIHTVQDSARPMSGTDAEFDHLLNSIAKQFDAVIHIDQTTALQPLDAPAMWEPHEEPETYPTGL